MEEGLEIKKFIKKKLQSGYPAGELKNDLLAERYTEAEIEKLFLDISLKGKTIEKQKNPKKADIHILSLLGASLLITGIGLMSIQVWLSYYSLHMIVLGAVGLVAGYVISTGKGPDK